MPTHVILILSPYSGAPRLRLADAIAGEVEPSTGLDHLEVADPDGVQIPRVEQASPRGGGESVALGGQCNLACVGCGRIQEYRETLGESLTLEECLESVEECGAPVVTVTGGEPLLYPPVFELVEELVHRKKHIYLCTNAILLEKALPHLPRSSRLTLSIHLVGLAATHDRLLGRPGLYDLTIQAIKAAKQQGFRVCTNTTIYKESDVQEIQTLLTYLTQQGIDGILVSPAYSFEGVAPELFLSREEIQEKFKSLTQNQHKFRFFRNPRGSECVPCIATARSSSVKFSPDRSEAPETRWLSAPCSTSPRAGRQSMHCVKASERSRC